MMMNPLAIVQEFYRALAAGQIEKVVALLSPDLQWEEAEQEIDTPSGGDTVASPVFAAALAERKTNR
jgi:ketosteroid isomerase-like protein